MDGGGSIVAYEEYLEHGEQATLDEIEAYNEDDCASTLGLRDWLEARRAEAEAQFGEIPRLEARDGVAPEAVSERELVVATPVGAAAGRRTRGRAAPALAARADARLAPPRSEARLLDVLRRAGR